MSIFGLFHGSLKWPSLLISPVIHTCIWWMASKFIKHFIIWKEWLISRFLLFQFQIKVIHTVQKSAICMFLHLISTVTNIPYFIAKQWHPIFRHPRRHVCSARDENWLHLTQYYQTVKSRPKIDVWKKIKSMTVKNKSC